MNINTLIMLDIAVPDDIPCVIKLMNTAYRSGQGWTNESHLVSGQRVSASHIQDLIASDTETLLLHKKDNRIIACICISVDKNNIDTAYIGSFAVYPEYQGSGLGSEVLLAAENYASKLGVITYKMQVLAPRTELIAYYERRGYKHTGEATPFPKHLNVGLPFDESLQIIELQKRVTN